MGKLFLLNGCLIVIIVLVLIGLKKIIKSEKGVNILFIILPLLTVVCHYSSLLYHYIKEGSCLAYLTSNPNLILPIYPCNVVMWCAVILAFVQKKNNRFTRFLCDYVFYFGVVSALVGLFANVDFIRNPDLGNYDILKGVLAHGFMLMNVLALPVFKKIKIDLPVNMINILISIVMMAIIGAYCNVVVLVLSSKDYMYIVNSMFLIHSPFDGVEFLKYGFISLCAIIAYFGIFAILELFVYKKGNRWTKRKFGW